MQNILLDTCTVIHLYQSKIKVLNLLKNYHKSQFVISVFTYGEFVAKVPLRQKNDAKKFLKDFRILPITTAFQTKLITYCSLYEVPKKQMVDFLIAATALQQNITLITENDKDFKKYKTLQIISYKL